MTILSIIANSTFVLLLAGTIVYALYLTATRLSARNLKKTAGGIEVPQTTPKFPFGDHFFLHPYDLKKYTDELNERFSGSLSVVTWLFFKPLNSVIHPEGAKELLSVPDSNYIRPPGPLDIPQRIFGTSILAAMGDNWQRQHRLLAKAFSFKNVRSMSAMMRQEVDIAIEKVKAENGGPVNVTRLMNSLTMRVVARCAFAFEDSKDPRLDRMINCVNYLISVNGRWYNMYGIAKWLPLQQNAKIENAFAELNSIVDSIIEQRRGQARDENRTYLIDILIDSQDQDDSGNLIKLSDLEVRDNAIVFLLAGSETTASTMTWFLAHMTEHPEVLKKVRAEIDTFFSNHKEEELGDSEEKLQYFVQTVNETMRITPAVIGTPIRQHATPRTLFGFEFPAMFEHNVSTYSIHRHKDFWPEPDVFNPDNFAPEIAAARHPYAFMPFSAGRRICIGKQFAIHEINLALPLMLRHLDFTLSPNHEIKPFLNGFLLGVKGDLFLNFTERKPL